MKSLYRVQRFTVTGSVLKDERAHLADDLTVAIGTDSAWRLPESEIPACEALEVGRSHLVAFRMDGPAIADGLRVTKLPAFAMNALYFDAHAKEYVMVTNGTDEWGRGPFRPTEAIALRALVSADGKVAIAWTYRAVDPVNLERSENPEEHRRRFDFVMSRKRSKKFIGRI